MAASGKKLLPGIQFFKGDITLERGQKSLPPQGSSQRLPLVRDAFQAKQTRSD